MESDNVGCPIPICRRADAQRNSVTGYDAFETECNNCGRFIVESTVPKYIWANRTDTHLFSFLIEHIREENQKGETPRFDDKSWEIKARERQTQARRSM